MLKRSEINVKVSAKLRGRKRPGNPKSVILKRLICCQCQTEFLSRYFRKSCSKPCTSLLYAAAGRNGGIKSSQVQSETRRSRNEIHFATLCQDRFQNVKTNEAIFNGWDADVVLLDEKIAIMWNGKWHYEKLAEKHSVLQVQNRDAIKASEIEKAGFRLYVIKDMGKEDPEFVKTQFDAFLEFITSK
jgi:hypothetical protein